MSRTSQLRMFHKLLRETSFMRRLNVFAKTERQNSTSTSTSGNERDPLQYYFNGEIQDLLQKLTGFEINKVYTRRLVPKYFKPYIKLVTDDELKQLQEKTLQKAERLLHMPPIMKGESEEVKIYSEDKEIAPFIDHKFIFTDITPGVKDRSRTIAVRDTDGTLRSATPEERRRCNQIYNPFEGRKVIMPKMFEKEHLENILHPDNYRYILEKACVQFEPDNPDFIRVCHRIYDHAAETRSFDALRSSRFFGPMAFYFAWNKNVDILLMDMLLRDLIHDALSLIKLCQMIHPEMILEKPVDDLSLENASDILMEFCKKYADHQHAGELELTIQAYMESLDSDEPKKNNA